MKFLYLVLISLLLAFAIGAIEASFSKTDLPVSHQDLPHSDFQFDDDDDDDAYEKLRTFGGTGSGGSSNPFQGKRLYNTSIALTASFFSWYLPSRTQPGTVTDLVNQAIYGLFGVLAVVLIFGVPVLFTGVKDTTMRSNGRSNNDLFDEDNGWISTPYNWIKIEQVKRVFDEEFRDQIGLDSTKCMQKTICEAHRSPKNKKYGLLVLPFQMFFPPPVNGTSEARASSYQIAAKNGKYSKKDCAEKYKCFFDTLDLSTFLIDWYRLSSDPEYVPKEPDFY